MRSLFNFSFFIVFFALVLLLIYSILCKKNNEKTFFPLFLAILLLALDPVAFLSQTQYLKYSGVFLVMLAIAINNKRVRIDKSFITQKTQTSAILMFGFILAGGLIGRLVFNNGEGSFPLLAALIPLVFGIPGLHVRENGEKILSLVSISCILIGLATLATRVNLLPVGSSYNYSHEKSFVFILGLLISFVIKRRFLFMISLIVFVANFYFYPAATYLAAVGGIAMSYIAIRFRKIALGKVMLVTSSLGAVAIPILTKYSAFNQLISAYFQSVNKTNNTNTRIELISVAERRIYERPFFGEFFAGNMTVQTNFNRNYSYSIDIHNDFLQILLGGGIFALVLYFIIIFSTQFRIMKFIRSNAHDLATRKLAFAFFATINVVLVTQIANPILMNPNSAIIFGTICYYARGFKHFGTTSKSQNDVETIIGNRFN